ncbi:MAG: sugar phosphate isomerase/epimerase [Planctomycetaceae bacterium]|jgi:sugar phosphate isomerase/epimerase|nr:sugar phosphate isomerase/epimerase [Planctomycetaceae bacterium]
MKRRDFFTASATIGVAGLALPTLSTTALAADTVPGDKRASAKLRFCSMLGIIPGSNDGEKLKWMKANGFEAVEIGGSPNSIDDAKDWKKKADDAGLEIASIYFGGAEIPLMSEDPVTHQKGLDEAKVRMEFAEIVGSPVLVYVPVRGNQPKEVKDQPERVLWERTVSVLKKLGPVAESHKTNVILEPLRRGEAWFMRQVSQAAKLAQEAGVPGVAILGDTYHMYHEEANSMAAFIAGGELVKHVHIGSGVGRQLPTAENHSAKGHTHTEAFRGLKYIGYDRFISFECGVGGSGNKEIEVPKCLDYFRKCWDEA